MSLRGGGRRISSAFPSAFTGLGWTIAAVVPARAVYDPAEARRSLTNNTTISISSSSLTCVEANFDP